MTFRSPILCLKDILKYTDGILSVSNKLSYQEFESSFEKQCAVCHMLEVIGEAAKRLHLADPSFQKRFPQIPWRSMARMRDMLIQHYEESEMDLIWDTIQNDVPTLNKQISEILNQLEGR